PGASASLEEVDLSVGVGGVVRDDAADGAVAGALEVQVSGGGGVGGDGAAQRERAGVGLHARLTATGGDRHASAERVVATDVADAVGAAGIVALCEGDRL